MTYLVTGATGFIGTKLVTALLSRGDAVYYLARKRSERLPSQASFHPWSSGEPDLTALSRIDGIFHLAGEPIAQRWSEEVKKRIYGSRVEGTRALVSALRRLPYHPSFLVSASAVGYYGDRGSDVLTEDQPPGNDFLARVCREWEAEAFKAQELGMRVAAVRSATVLGRDGGALKKMLPIFRLGLGGRFGDGRQWMSWVHVADLIRLFLFLADSPGVSGPLNGSSPQPVTNSHFTNALGDALHRPAVIPAPKTALRLLLGEMSSFLFASLRVVPRAAGQAGFRFEYPALEAALQSLV